MSLKRATAEFVLANDISNYLCHHYPGHKWAVAVDTHQGIIKILEPDLQEANLPYIIRQQDVTNYKKLQKMAMKAGGEILERCRISRERQRVSSVQDRIMGVDRDIRGVPLFDKRGNVNWVG